MATLTNTADDYAARVKARAVLIANKLDKVHAEKIGERESPWLFCECDKDNPAVVPNQRNITNYCPKCGAELYQEATYTQAFELIRAVTNAVRTKATVLTSNPLTASAREQKRRQVERTMADLVEDTETAAILRQLMESGAVSLS